MKCPFKVCVRPELPVKGVHFIIGNNLAGGKVRPVLEVLDTPDDSLSDPLLSPCPEVFSAISPSQSLQRGGEIDLSD